VRGSSEICPPLYAEDNSRATKRSRSAVFEEAIMVWKKRRLDEDLRKGYEAMARADRETAEQNLAVGAEGWDGQQVDKGRLIQCLGTRFRKNENG